MAPAPASLPSRSCAAAAAGRHAWRQLERGGAICRVAAQSRIIARTRSFQRAPRNPGAAPQHPPRTSRSRLPRLLPLAGAGHMPCAGLRRQQQPRLPGPSDSLQQGGLPARSRRLAMWGRSQHPTNALPLLTPASLMPQQTSGLVNCWRPAMLPQLQRVHRFRLNMARRRDGRSGCVRHWRLAFWR